MTFWGITYIFSYNVPGTLEIWENMGVWPVLGMSQILFVNGGKISPAAVLYGVEVSPKYEKPSMQNVYQMMHVLDIYLMFVGPVYPSWGGL